MGVALLVPYIDATATTKKKASLIGSRRIPESPIYLFVYLIV